MMALSSTGRNRSRPGRPSKAGARFPSGQLREHDPKAEKPEQVLATAVEARMRHFGVDRKEARDPLLGSAFGRLRRADLISAVQYRAGVRFARLWALQGVLDDVRPAYGVPVLARLACTFGSDPYGQFDPDRVWDDVNEQRERLKKIAQVRRDAADVATAMWELEASEEGRGAAYLIGRVTLWDDPVGLEFSTAKLGTVRYGLNALVRLWRLEQDTRES